MNLQQFMELFQLQLVVGDKVDFVLLPLDHAFAALEVETSDNLAVDGGYRIVHFREIKAGDDIEAGHD